MTTEERMKRLEELAERGHVSTDDIRWLLQRLKETREALAVYADEKNWGNGGFHGERNTVWMGKGLRGSDLAKRILEG